MYTFMNTCKYMCMHVYICTHLYTHGICVDTYVTGVNGQTRIVRESR